MIRSLARSVAIYALTLLAAAPLTAQSGPAVDPILFQGMEWRLVGPFRGGRSVAVAGVAGDPLTYYFGATGGGVWKTTDAGNTWRNVSDGWFRTGSVGAVAVAPSDPNVVYVGMGEAPIRGVTTSHGDGVYRSTDAGRTWSHLGLEATEHISNVIVHPLDPDTVWVAAQGSSWKPNPERGIYRSTDGGATWQHVLHVSDEAGASDLTIDPSNPRVLFAGFWDHQRLPWQVRSGGPGSGVWKSSDGGDTWRRMPQKGMEAEGDDEDAAGPPMEDRRPNARGRRGPRGGSDAGKLPELMGKVGVAASARPGRVWALVEAEDGGLFRSDDGGETWTLVNGDRVLRARAWYYIHVEADPVDPDTVYVMNAPFMKSEDGGRTFRTIDTPHGDNHDLWIAPEDNRRMINGNDGGANVTFNGGESWSTQGNQPTAQFYRVDTDATFPYTIYGGQQDNSTVAIRSAAPGGIGVTDWHAVSGCESAHLAFDPDNPRYVYGGCYQGIIGEWDAVTRTERDVMAVPYLGLGVDPIDQPYRFNWNAPIEVSPHDPSVIYHAGNVLLRSSDRGVSWTEVSPDLTRDEEDKQQAGGAPITNEAAGGETYGTIFYIALSPHEEGVIWTGSDDGLVHLTRDGGESWNDVTPPELPESQINAIEVSPHDPGTAYLAVTRYKLGDYTPYGFRTEDYGATWRRIAGAGDFPEGSWLRVIREDPEYSGLLYAGTETGAWVSFDDGGRWQPLELGLPVVPVTDLQVREDDLVAATQGRAFWVLDDLAPLRAVPDMAGGDGDLRLLDPAPAHRVFWGGGWGGGGAVGENPPSGAVIDYYLSEELAGRLAAGPGGPGDAGDEEGEAMDEAAGDEGGEDGADEPAGPPALEMEIVDADGDVVRSYSSRPEGGPGGSGGGGGGGPFGGGGRDLLPVEAGMNRFVWDLQGEETLTVPDLFAFTGEVAPRMPPGRYTIRLTAPGAEGEEDDLVAEAELQVLEDPRVDTTGAGYAEQQALFADVRTLLEDLNDSVIRAREVKRQVEAQIARAEDLEDEDAAEAIEEAGKEIVKALEEWEGTVVQTETETFQDVINFRNKLDAQVGWLLNSVDTNGSMPSAGARPRYEELAGQWAEREEALEAILEDVAAYNDLVAEHGVPAVVVPPAGKHLEDE
jgi:photosystem II stability/assembly factor-like uncharacterized protein